MLRSMLASTLAPIWKGLHRAATPATAVAICAAILLLTGNPILAQGDAPAAEAPADVPVVTEAPPQPPPTDPPPPAPTDPPPPPPTDPPPPPTEAPVIVEPTAIPTDAPVPSTEAPAGDPPLEPTALPSEEPSATPTPTPTATPEPELAYRLADAPDCQLAPDGPSSVASGSSIDYVCTDQVSFIGSNVVPANIDVVWSIRTAIGGGWSLQVLPPQNTPEEVVTWTPEDSAEAGFDFNQANPVGVSVMPGAVDTSASVSFGLRVHRATCAMQPQTVELFHDVTVQSPGTTIEPAASQAEPHRITPDLQAVPEPVVAFDGPLNFGEVGLTAAGADATVRSGTLALTVTSLDTACGAWDAQVSATALTNQAGAPMTGSRLVVVSIDDQPIPDGGCDLATGCDLGSLAAGPDAPSTRTMTLGVELHMPQQPGPGSFTTSIDALLLPAANS